MIESMTCRQCLIKIQPFLGVVRGNYNPPEDLYGERAPPLRLRGGDGNENDGNIGDNLSLRLLKRLWPFLHWQWLAVVSLPFFHWVTFSYVVVISSFILISLSLLCVLLPLILFYVAIWYVG